MRFIYAQIGNRNRSLAFANDNGFFNKGKPIPGFPEVFTAGLDGEIYKNGKPLKGHMHRKGYRRVNLRVDSIDKNYYVHSLVAAAFIGPRPEGHHVDHIDFDKLNNRPENLRYLPALENSMRRCPNGRRSIDIATAKEMRLAGETYASIARRIGASSVGVMQALKKAGVFA